MFWQKKKGITRWADLTSRVQIQCLSKTTTDQLEHCCKIYFKAFFFWYEKQNFQTCSPTKKNTTLRYSRLSLAIFSCHWELMVAEIRYAIIETVKTNPGLLKKRYFHHFIEYWFDYTEILKMIYPFYFSSGSINQLMIHSCIIV